MKNQKILFIPPTLAYLHYVANNICPQDKEEARNSGYISSDEIYQILKFSCSTNGSSAILTYKNFVIGAGGVTSPTLLNSGGVAWFILCKDRKHTQGYKRPLFRALLEERDHQLTKHAYLYNWVHSSNKDAMRLLRWLGATFDKPNYRTGFIKFTIRGKNQ